MPGNDHVPIGEPAVDTGHQLHRAVVARPKLAPAGAGVIKEPFRNQGAHVEVAGDDRLPGRPVPEFLSWVETQESGRTA
jgi:hypothetical protein